MSDQQDLANAIGRFADSDADQLWLVADDVYFDLGEPRFFHALESCRADLLSTLIEITSARGSSDPGRGFGLSGRSLKPGRDEELTMLPSLTRISRAAGEVIRDGFERGSDRRIEVLLPTLVRHAGLSIEEIGGGGALTPRERIGQHYDTRTWQQTGPIEHVPGMLHHPVPVHSRPLARYRISSDEGIEPAAKILYVSPVGKEAAELLPSALACFQSAGADCLLLQYDDADLAVPHGVRVIRDRGHKWQLALRHLRPDSLSEYDFVFFWDDDIGVQDFDPRRFVAIMQSNRLDAAQPAIDSRHLLSHAITARRPCPPPLRTDGGEITHTVVGRLTNFVEIMAPVFSRRAWREMYHYLDPDNVSGWGYDFVPLGRKGIVDLLPVEHTRPSRSPGSDPNADLNRFLDNQGLLLYERVDEGLLIEPAARGAGTPDRSAPASRSDSTSRVSDGDRSYRVIRI